LERDIHTYIYCMYMQAFFAADRDRAWSGELSGR